MLNRLILLALSAACITQASIFSSGPDIDIKAQFAGENALNEVKNGVQNTLLLSLICQSELSSLYFTAQPPRQHMRASHISSTL
jgi:hypothetical protein